MIVKELIKKLEEMPQDMEVMTISEFDQANEIEDVGVAKEKCWNDDADCDKKIVYLDCK